MEWIGATFTSDAGWRHLERLVDGDHRMAGSEGERRGAELTRDALSAAGADQARLDPFEIQGWRRGGSQLEAGGTEQDCTALPRSPDAEATGRYVDIGYGLPEAFEADLSGAVVGCRSGAPAWFDRPIHRREKYYRAVEAGAGAFVFAGDTPGGLAPTGSVGTSEEPIGPIPAVGVSREVSERLDRRFDGETVRVAVDATLDPAESATVRARLGPDTDERVLVTSHVDAHDISEGAMDNGAGTAMLVEVAGALAARADDPDAPSLATGVEFVAFGAEEVGLIGSTRYAGDADGVRAVLNLDGVCRARTLEIATHGSDALAAATRTVADRFDHPIELRPDYVPHSDHWPFVARGVPGALISSAAGEGRGWGHTAADTIDKLEARDLREGAILVAALAGAVTERPVAALDTDEVAAALEDSGAAAGMRATGDWPF